MPYIYRLYTCVCIKPVLLLIYQFVTFSPCLCFSNFTLQLCSALSSGAFLCYNNSTPVLDEGEQHPGGNLGLQRYPCRNKSLAPCFVGTCGLLGKNCCSTTEIAGGCMAGLQCNSTSELCDCEFGLGFCCNPDGVSVPIRALL